LKRINVSASHYEKPCPNIGTRFAQCFLEQERSMNEQNASTPWVRNIAISRALPTRFEKPTRSAPIQIASGAGSWKRYCDSRLLHFEKAK
jgi:hypothetical protein